MFPCSKHFLLCAKHSFCLSSTRAITLHDGAPITRVLRSSVLHTRAECPIFYAKVTESTESLKHSTSIFTNTVEIRLAAEEPVA